MSFSSFVTIPLVFASGIWIPSALLCSNAWFQRQMLYLNNVSMWPGKGLEEPERLGFLKNQVATFRIPTTDGESLFGWLVAPLGVYKKNLDLFENEKASSDIEQRQAFRCLEQDPEARLLIYFHGNAATIAQIRRTEEYRKYSAGASDKIFVLVFDYRGFGLSSGGPSETGLINDGVSIVDWALNVAKIPPGRIVLMGHSLGTAVSTAVIHHYLHLPDPIEFHGLILCAGFTNAKNAFISYAIAGVFPILVPLKYISFLESSFARTIHDAWKTDERLTQIVQKSSTLRLAFIHANNDLTMPWQQTEQLFRGTVSAAIGRPLLDQAPDEAIQVESGDDGVLETWSFDSKTITKLIMTYGGHDMVMLSDPVSLRVLQFFGLENQPAA